MRKPFPQTMPSSSLKSTFLVLFHTVAVGINDAEQIVGRFVSFDGGMPTVHGFLDDGGVFTQIDVPGSLATYPSGINNGGDVGCN